MKGTGFSTKSKVKRTRNQTKSIQINFRVKDHPEIMDSITFIFPGNQ